jgi:hypothetical protein
MGLVNQFSQQGGTGHLSQVESVSEGFERSPVRQVSHMGVSDKSHWTSLVKAVGGPVGHLGRVGRWVKWERGSSGPNEWVR